MGVHMQIKRKSRAELPAADANVKKRQQLCCLSIYSAIFITSFLLYVPQDLQTLCACISIPHLEHGTRLSVGIFQLWAFRLSLLALEVLPLGQIDICYTSSFENN
jgi:hypothetical protein